MKSRIHQKCRDAEGRRNGTNRSKTAYNTKYAVRRKKKGRQIAFIDLHMEGDLEKGYGTGKSNNKNVIGFTTDEQARKAKYVQEEFKPVFNATEKEEKELYENIKKATIKVIKKAVGGIF